MSKKVYVCRECGHVFPKELSNLIENKVQVFCEFCGMPFSLRGVKLTQEKFQNKKTLKIEKKSIKLDKSILKLNKISYIPILIISIFFLILTLTNLVFLPIGLAGLIISIYDRKYISPRLKEGKYNEIIFDAFCLGILGCIIYGTGVILLIKGILILIYAFNNPINENRNRFDISSELKNSLNNFSSLAGLLIILLAFYSIGIRAEPFAPIIFVIFLPISIIALFIDLALKKKIKRRQKFGILEALGILILGILGSFFYAAGIFILFKGILCFTLITSEPIDIIQKEEAPIKEEIPYLQPRYIEPRPPIQEKKIEKIYAKKEGPQIEERKKPAPYRIPPIEPAREKFKKIGKEEISKKPKERKILVEKEKDIELKLHDSLLPVKDDKDKMLVKQYFSKIFTVLSKDLRQLIIDLKIPKKQKKELLKELAFLTKEEQVKYIKAFIDLYQEMPIKLIERIKKLPNVRPEYYVQIAEQLKFMDYEEKLRFVEFLENNA